MDLDAAIVQSCDVFFYKLAYELGVDQLNDFLSQFGFGGRTGIDLTGESTGLLPSREWKRRQSPTMVSGETLIMGIGQGLFPRDTAAAGCSDRGHRQQRDFLHAARGRSPSRESETSTPIPPQRTCHSSGTRTELGGRPAGCCT